jgi:dihydroorotate dehydrogenase (NAD+) catalytic subunit
MGMGGIMNEVDVVEFLLAGAHAVQVGTANFVDPLSAVHIVDGLARWCGAHDIRAARELVGKLES